MMKRILLTAMVFALSGCAGTGNPWSTPGTVQQAEQAPHDLFGASVVTPPVESAPVPPVETAVLVEPTPPPVQKLKAAPPVKVALLAPLSGKHADLGQALLQAAQLALFDMGYNAFELMPQDTGGTPGGAQKAAQEAISNGAQLILGPLFAGSVSAVKPIARNHDISMISFSTDWNQADDNTFIMGFLPFSQVQRVTEYAASQGIRRIGILAPDNAYGNAVIAAYNSTAHKLGLSTSHITRFPAEQADLTHVVSSFVKADSRAPGDPPPFDAVLLPVGGEQARSIANMLSFHELGPDVVRRLGTGLWDDPGLATEPALEGAWFAAPSPDSRRRFERRYADTYGLAPPRIASLAYDATALAAVLARSGAQTTGTVTFDHASLTNPNGFSGIDGAFRFRRDGLVERGLAVLEYRDSQIQAVDDAPRTFQSWAGQ